MHKKGNIDNGDDVDDDDKRIMMMMLKMTLETNSMMIFTDATQL